VQASAPDYPRVLTEALRYPDTDDEDGEPLIVHSGEIALFSAACDGTGPHSQPLVPADQDRCRWCRDDHRTGTIQAF
jgi:hypothetical protein